MKHEHYCNIYHCTGDCDPPMKKKIRKPRNIFSTSWFPLELCEDNMGYFITINSAVISYSQAKRLHAWLDKAIAYLESQKK